MIFNIDQYVLSFKTMGNIKSSCNIERHRSIKVNIKNDRSMHSNGNTMSNIMYKRNTRRESNRKINITMRVIARLIVAPNINWGE